MPQSWQVRLLTQRPGGVGFRPTLWTVPAATERAAEAAGKGLAIAASHVINKVLSVVPVTPSGDPWCSRRPL